MQSIRKLGYVMPKIFIVKNVFVEITVLVSVAISLILLKVLHRLIEHLM